MVNSGSSTPKSKLVHWWESLTPPSRLLAIALAAPFTVLNAWAFSEIFGYFRSLFVILLVGALLAFLLNYPVRWLEHKGVKRGQASLLVFLVAVLLVLALGVTLFPLVFTQAQQLVVRLPEWIDSGRRQLVMLDEQLNARGLPVSLDGIASQLNARLKGELQSIAGQALNLTLSLTVFTVVRLLDVLLTVVLTFYLLQNSDTIWHSIVQWLPARLQQPFSQTLSRSFQNFFFGQIISATCMALGLTSAFLFLKLPFGLLFGLTIGFMALVPFGGSLGIAIVTLLVALENITLALQVLVVALIVQQVVENFIAPRVLGSVTGLNPFWIFVALLAGARVGGFLGVVVAVPTAVVIKEILIAARSVNKVEHSSDHLASDAATPTVAVTATSADQPNGDSKALQKLEGNRQESENITR
ncbi:AI-2E family transporter [Oculatella sp. LEGE 06141]|uniref:AI-2E family transporter n=1 Tax=Oculatella sp. LEGE 06141 TaxID=1828648 RepID=UPI001881EECE|nr:AI-2E family transporter [Oculatella sp. LEGE 06141]MBE9180920.1 AI-2E family transporter [Oculatella sp. LEGE 06141]